MKKNTKIIIINGHDTVFFLTYDGYSPEGLGWAYMYKINNNKKYIYMYISLNSSDFSEGSSVNIQFNRNRIVVYIF